MINTIFFNNIEISLRGRNLIITGSNGAGKTRFLRKLNNELKSNKNTNTDTISNIEKREEIFNLLKNGINNYLESLSLKNSEIKILNLFIHNRSNNINFDNELKFIKSLFNSKFSSFQKDKINYLAHTTINEKQKNLLIKNPNSVHEKYFYYHNSSHIENFIASLNNLIDSYLTNRNELVVITATNNNQSPYFFSSSRVGKDNFSIKGYQPYDSFINEHPQRDIEGALEAYLILQKSELLSLIKHRNTESTEIQKINTIQNWIIKVENDLKIILENESTELSFNQKGNEILITQNNGNVFFKFDSLSSGFKAIFNIYTNLLMRAHLSNLSPENFFGIVIVDEIDVHLHISLQKKILPFFTKAFPNIQFIVSTHSPFVITSTNEDTLVYDLTSKELIEDDLSGYSNEAIIKGLFHVEPTNHITSNIIKYMEQLLKSKELNFRELRDFITFLQPLEKKNALDKKSRNLYLQIVNLLADNNQLDDLDV